MPVPISMFLNPELGTSNTKATTIRKDFTSVPHLPKIIVEYKNSDQADQLFRFPHRYKYIRLIGHGAYGMVCAAMDHNLGHQVAIKRINQISCLLVAKRTLRELKLLRHFQNHPNIISIRDLFLLSPPSSFDEIYITQDLMDADLSHIIQSKYTLSDEHCRRSLYQILCGLKALHSANVIHRDLKPGNLLWRQTGELKICDFGLARGLLDAPDNKDLTMTNYVATRWYRPPEILLYKSHYGKPLDIWSVGCIFAELLGRRVFLPGGNGFEQLHLILQKLGTPPEEVIERIPSEKSKMYLRRLPRYSPYPLSQRFPNAPLAAIDLLYKMLAFDPDDRITVEEALAHPYLSRYHDPAKEPTCPLFTFEFEKTCNTLAEIKSCILEEVSRYHANRPVSPLTSRMNRLDLDDSQSRNKDNVNTKEGPKRGFDLSSILNPGKLRERLTRLAEGDKSHHQSA